MSRYLIALWACLIGLLFLGLLVGGCGAPTPTEPVAVPSETYPPAATNTPVSVPTATEAAATPITPIETSVPLTTELKATVVAGLPPTPTADASGQALWAEMDVSVLPLHPAEGSPPLWVAFSVGMGFYDMEAGPFVAVYTYGEEGWRELSRVVLTGCAEYVGPESLAQVQLEPSRIWLEMQSGTGVHSGCYDLLSFDGRTLRREAWNFNSSPGVGGLADLDGDGTPEVILDQTEYYVFCYACGVRLPMFRVLRWDGERLVEVRLAPLPNTVPADLQRLNNRAVELARAGLWKDAQAAIAQAWALAAREPTVTGNKMLIDLHGVTMAEQVREGIYPLLANLFYGDYPAALAAMRPYSMEQIWGPGSPLIVGTPAEGWDLALSDWISMTTNLALSVEPDPSGLGPSEQGLAPVYFLRGWATHLRSPGDPAALADVEHAAELDPAEPLFTQSAAYLKPPAAQQTPALVTEKTPASAAPKKPTPTAQKTPTPAAQEQWQVRTLLAGPGEPGRLYALLADESSGAWPAQRARFLISDDYGQSWSPFPAGLPAKGCVRNVNLDYATPDALYASTCQGLHRWSGSEWRLISPQETGMVAVVYGKPQVIWATDPFASGGAVIRSDDGGATWVPASSGLVHFNGVANVGIDPRDANTLYAVIWPKYAGSYLRRGAANGQWQTMSTPLGNAQIGTGMTIDGTSGALYVMVQSPQTQLWRTLNPAAPDLKDVRWELVHDFGKDIQAELLASGWSPQGLALYANLWPLQWKAAGYAEVGAPVLHRSLDGGRTWSPLPIPEPEG
jgi:hypothetical protein